MDAFERYIHRVGRNGDNPNTSTMNSSKKSLNKVFHTSPSFSQVLLNNILTDAIVYHEENYNEKTILFRPDTNVNIGSVVGFNDNIYLLMSFFDRELDPKGELLLCNNSLTIKGEPTETQIGTNPHTGQPVYEYQEGTPITYPCIVTKLMENEQLKNLPININGDTIKVILPYFEFKENQIELYGEKYQIKSIDKTKVINGIGLLTILGERV